MSKKLIILSGLSGSGNTTLIKELLDLNYFILSSLKTKNYYQILETIIQNSKNDKIAVFLNISEDYDTIYKDVLKIKNNAQDVEFIQIFLKASKEAIINRYQENRKIHPYIKNIDKKSNILKSIEKEEEIAQNFIKQSDYIIDTTSLFPKQLVKLFRSYINESQKFTINLFSFGFKYGSYHYSDYIFDVRFLKNPYYEKELKDKSGENKEVKKFVFSDQDAIIFFNHILAITYLIIPRYKKVDKDSITISFGCTGGKHRSVAFVEMMAKFLEKKYEVNKIHLEKEKGRWND